MTSLARRPWVPDPCEDRVQTFAGQTSRADNAAIFERIETLAGLNRDIHERLCFNLNPATNTINPRAEALLARGLGSRPSLGYPGEKYETGLEAIEEIEVIAAELCAAIFDARFAEIRVPSGAIANLYAFMACCEPGDAIIVPPGTIGGHVTHHDAGAAGLFGLDIHEAPVDARHYTIDLDGLEALARDVHPKLITLGGSLNLFPHAVGDAARIAHGVGARLLFDAAHLCGMIAGKVWPDPLAHGADLMTMSTYKSLGGPAGGLVVTNDPVIARDLDRIAFPGLTANFDAGRVAALAVAMLDWRSHGQAYAAAMVANAQALAKALDDEGLALFAREQGFTTSHQFALAAHALGGGQHAARKLRRANILACGIGLPAPPVPGDLNGLRLGTPEITRWGMDEADMPMLASFIARALASENPQMLAAEVSAARRTFDRLHFVDR